MSTLQKIVLQKKVWCCVVVAELLFLAAAGFFYDRREKIDINYTQDDLVDDSGQGEAFYVDNSYAAQYIATPDFILPKGIYTLEAQYEYVGQVRLEAVYVDGGFDSDAGGRIHIKESGEVACDFRVKYPDRPLHIRGRLAGDASDQDYLLIRNIRITTAAVGTRNFVFRIVVLFMVLDFIMVLYIWKDKIFADSERIEQCKYLFLIVCLCSLPLTVNYLFRNAQDLEFHLMRIEGIKDGLQNGIFPVKIQNNWLNDHGYAVSVFYGDALLYIPAVLRMFGVSVLEAYKCYVFILNVLTTGISYHCFSKLSNRRNGMICAALYTLNVFRLYDLYARAAVGETTAMAFMPLVLYGLWKVYKLPEESREHERSWITILFGCTGVFLSHMISTEMTAFFIILAAIILWKKTIRKKTFIVLLKALVSTLLVNLWFLLPFLDYMMSGTYAINCLNRYAPYRLEDKGGFLVQLFMTEYEVMGAAGGIDTRGAAGGMPHTVGNALMLILIGWFLMCLWQKEKHIEDRKEEYLAVFLSVLCIFMTRCTFPYTWLVSKIPILKFPVHGLQFQWRFLAIAIVLLLWLLCVIMQKDWISRKKKIAFAGLLLFLSVGQAVSYISGLMNEADVWHIYQEGGLDSCAVIFGEYLPVGNPDGFSIKEYLTGYQEALVYDPASVNVEEWHREKASVVVRVHNMSDESKPIEVPLILYKGYRAVADNGEQLQISPGSFYRISVSVPAGYSGNIRIGFQEPWYWRICEIISLTVLLSIIIYRGYDRRERQKALISK